MKVQLVSYIFFLSFISLSNAQTFGGEGTKWTYSYQREYLSESYQVHKTLLNLAIHGYSDKKVKHPKKV